MFYDNIFFYSEGDIPEAILKGFLAADEELRTYGNATELTGSTGTYKVKHIKYFQVAKSGK